MRGLLKAAAGAAAFVGWGLVAVVRNLSAPAGTDAEGRSTAGLGGTAVRMATRHPFLTLAGLLAAVGAGGFLVAASGIIPIKASSKHWAITAWFLEFSKSRSVATHTMGLEAPPLDKPHLVLRGAGHYHSACRPCHGSPELRSPKIALAMTPQPPYLPTKTPERDPEEVFYIVKHGIKFTGMPAWPAQQRDDEVWAMVAFLLRLPDLDAEAYRRLVHGEAPASEAATAIGGLVGNEKMPRAVLESCGRCHGLDGLGRGPGAFPALAGQRPDYLFAALEAYARGHRHSGIMEPVAATLSVEEMKELARYYGALDPARPAAGKDVAAIERGKVIAQHGIPAERVPACAECHGPAEHRHNPAYPVLAGQDAGYLRLQLDLFKKDQRGGSAYAHLMREVAPRLTEQQMSDVALYFESLEPASDRPEQ